MPSRDEDGRELSGADKARLRTDRAQAAIDAEQEKVGDERPAWSKEFDEAGRPDLVNSSTEMDFVRKLQLIVIRQMATTPFPGPAQRECWRRIQAMAATIGMTHNKSGIESEVKALRAMFSDRKQRQSFVYETAPGKVAKPATARGQRRGGPRSIPQDALPPEEPTESEEPEDDDPAE